MRTRQILARMCIYTTLFTVLSPELAQAQTFPNGFAVTKKDQAAIKKQRSLSMDRWLDVLSSESHRISPAFDQAGPADILRSFPDSIGQPITIAVLQPREKASATEITVPLPENPANTRHLNATQLLANAIRTAK